MKVKQRKGNKILRNGRNKQAFNDRMLERKKQRFGLDRETVS
ncbi:unnamed protein product [Paramecium sonneborni]|uniref:Uncharacterized protein n=1 Tax=Paramecium sonneborni TaxID=65129 RepID=A0A8S1Q0N4_9CILI|nr:unnamed protein product [Paramecium sonneborni]